MRNIILIAPPAAGKGTVSSHLKDDYGYVHISTGDLLRDEIKSGSEFGKTIQSIINEGKLVDNETLKKLVKQKLESIGEKSFVLDGYPRLLDQAKDYEEIINELGLDFGKVYFLEVNEQTAMERTLGRVICPTCKATYNKYIDGYKPKEENICDICKSKLEGRLDDNEETFKTRFEIYMKETEPLINYYEEKENLTRIDASRKTDEILNDLILTLGE